MEPFLKQLLTTLTADHVRFVVIGGVALNLRGHLRATEDLDICYARDRENLVALVRALSTLHPSLRGAPKELPFALDLSTLRMGLNFTLDTDAGPLDLLGEVAGVGGFAAVDALSSEMVLHGQRVLVLSIEGLERAKRAAGRPKDLLDLGALQALKKKLPPA